LTLFHGSPDAPDAPDGPGAASSADGHPRHRGAPTMRSLPEHLAAGLDVRLATRVVRLAAGVGGCWVATTDDGTTHTGRVLVATPPVPQTLALLDAGGVDLPGEIGRTLREATYERTIALLAVPVDRGHDGPLLGPRGARRLDTPPIAWLADNASKGVSPTPALTVHADGATSADLWDHDDDAVAASLLPAVAAHVDLPLRVVHVQRWRYATPLHDLGAVTLHAATPAPLWVAGDACTGGRVEGAARSGLAAGAGVVDLLA
jgi:renalase